MSVLIHNSLYRLYFLTGTLSGLGSTLFSIVFVIYARHMPDPKLAVIIASILATLPMVFMIVMGYFADQTANHFQQQLKNRLILGGLYLLVGGLMSRPASWPIFSLLLALDVVSSLIGTYNGLVGVPVVKDIVAPEDIAESEGLSNGVNVLGVAPPTFGQAGTVGIVLNADGQSQRRLEGFLDGEAIQVVDRAGSGNLAGNRVNTPRQTNGHAPKSKVIPPTHR